MQAVWYVKTYAIIYCYKNVYNPLKGRWPVSFYLSDTLICGHTKKKKVHGVRTHKSIFPLRQIYNTFAASVIAFRLTLRRMFGFVYHN
jgi:hypothetical protein